MTPDSIYRGLSSYLSPWTSDHAGPAHIASKKTTNGDCYVRGPMTVAKLTTLGTAGSTIALALSLPGAKAQACPSYCYRSISADQTKCALVGAMCIEGGPLAVIAASALERYAIEYDKKKCAEMNCGPFMSP